MIQPDERPLCGVCAARLAGQGQLGWLSLLVTAAALLALTQAGASVGWALVLLLGAAERYVAVRLAIDARLFGQLGGSGLALEQLDAALAALGMSPKGKAGRPLRQRVDGALAWARCHSALVVAQALLAAALLAAGR